jgi:predicted GNAT family acetyltransferase
MSLVSLCQELELTHFVDSAEPSRVEELYEEDKEEALKFLSARPIHTVYMVSLIRDNGLTSPRNRGSFYGCRDRYGDLEGVALIGHATIVETQSESALMAFARMARNCQSHLIRGEQDTIERFWNYYSSSAKMPRLTAREHLLEARQAFSVQEQSIDLRPATMGDLDNVISVNASLALQESGINPLQHDLSGFRQRTARRIEQGRVWVWTEDNRLMFKTDVVAETPRVIYLEGVHVHEEERRKGYGLRCLTQLSATLLERTDSICLSINEKNQKTQTFYEKAGYQFHSDYQTIYLR